MICTSKQKKLIKFIKSILKLKYLLQKKLEKGTFQGEFKLRSYYKMNGHMLPFLKKNCQEKIDKDLSNLVYS